MPEIKRFGGFKLLMFFQDAIRHTCISRAPTSRRRIRIANGDLLAGDAPSRVLRRARRWVEENRTELKAMWDEFQR